MSNNSLTGVQYQNSYSTQNHTDIASKEIENRKRTEHLFKTYEFDRDTYEKGESLKVLNCENYPNYNNKIGMPEHIFATSFGYEMQKNIEMYMDNYYKGNVSEEDVKEFFQDCCKTMLKHYTQRCQTSGQDDKDNKTIISEIFEVFCDANKIGALNANRAEGMEINKNYQQGSRNDFAYYNSDYYYKCEEMRDIFREMVKVMEGEWNTSTIDIASVEKNTRFTLYGNFDFNSSWNVQNRNNVIAGSMIDENMEPPKDFKLFFKQRPYLENKKSYREEDWIRENTGILLFECNGFKKEVDVPFSFKAAVKNPDWLDSNIFNANSLINLSDLDVENHKMYHAFLANFEVFTRLYSNNTEIENTFGSYRFKK